MLGTVRLYDYRCFRREHPASLELRPGFTAFIGPNNAGKSSLIRSLYEIRNAFPVAMAVLSAPQDNLKGQRNALNLMPPLYENAELVFDRDDPDPVIEFSVPWQADMPPVVRRLQIQLDPDGSGMLFRAYGSDALELSGIPGSDRQVLGREGQNIWVTGAVRYDASPMQTLLEAVSDILFIGPFRNALNEGAGAHYDTRIGTSFIEEWNTWKTGPNRAKQKAVEDVTDDVRRLVGAETLQISASHDKKTLQISVDKRPQKLQDLGSGIAQLIVVLGNAMIRRPSFVVIDEPELHLHPGLQIDFLTSLASYARYGVLFSTHSIGLARTVGDQCFTVQKNGAGATVRSLEKTPHYAEFLGSLGIAGLQEIGWDAVLLVEGPKDVRTFQQFLRTYGKDRKVVVLPLGGDSLVNGVSTHEIQEVLRLCPKVFAVVDSERPAAGAPAKESHQKFEAMCTALKIPCCLTQLRAIENYLSQSSLDVAFKKRCKQLGPFDEPGPGFWGKGESWRAAQHMTRKELDKTDIGALLGSIE